MKMNAQEKRVFISVIFTQTPFDTEAKNNLGMAYHKMTLGQPEKKENMYSVVFLKNKINVVYLCFPVKLCTTSLVIHIGG